jgi:hypothetical protein
MPKKLILIILLTVSWYQVFPQDHPVTGKVFDEKTGLPLAFVNIVTNNSNIGTATDIDGKFKILSNQKVEFLRLSYVGYDAQTFYLHGKQKRIEIFLTPATFQLEEVKIVAGENPAHRIIKNVIANSDKNNPEKLPSFSYTAYDKMIFTIDTLETEQSDINPQDSGYIRLKSFLADKDFFMMETVSERRFMKPDRNREKVLASRISGFRDPVLLFLSSQLQSSTFYHELIKITDKNYINPISRGSIKKYFFQIEDTTYTSRGDSVFIISFRPGINTNFDGLKGVLSINTHGWAIQNVIAEPARDDRGMSVKIQQMYELINDSTWFPRQLNTDVIFNNVLVNNLIPIGKGKSYLMDIELNPELVKRQFNHIEVEFDPNAGDRDEEFWLAFRGDSLSGRERRTYEYIDSVGRQANLDKMANTIKSLLNSRLPVGKIDIDLLKTAKFNNYEGIYLGLGLLTNQRFSQTIEAGAFWGYGFRDKFAKYGGNFSITIDKYREIKLNLSYFDDVTETGGVKFYGVQEGLLNPASFRNFLVKHMDHTERMHASIVFRVLRYGTFNLGITKDRKRITNDYYFDRGDSGLPGERPEYDFTEFSAGFRYAHKEKFMDMPDSRISLGTRYPVIWFQYTQGLKDVFDGTFSYHKFDLKIEKSFFIKYFGETRIDLLAGYVDRPVPQTNLYNGRGSYRLFTIYTPVSFATQRMGEFLASKYIFLFYTHNFGKLLWRTKNFAPEFALAANFGFGDLDHPEYHKGVDFKVMDRGYIESGLLINNLLNMNGALSLGLGAFFRHGYYKLPETADNFAYKISVEFAF